MRITTTRLARAAGICAAAAGTIFVAVQIGHPPMRGSSVVTNEWVVRNSAKVLMAVLALAGITGIYLRQARRLGVLGLVGYVVFGAGYVLMVGVEMIGAFVLPTLARSNPGYVNDIVVAAAGGHPVGDIGRMQTVFTLSGIGYMVGGLLFGVALFRARVLARWAAALLAVGTSATVALAALPESFNRPFAVPTGIALIGLGVSQWRNARDAAPAVTSAAAASPTGFEPAPAV